MNCPRCKGNITAGRPERVKHDINGYQLKRFLLKIAGHEYLFYVLEYAYQVPGDSDPRWQRIRYEWQCDHCDYTWDAVWPALLEIDGKKWP